MPARIFIGAEFFRELREDNCYYVDKTGFIEELLSENPSKVSLFTRPRRFGKTLMMTMLRDFLISGNAAKLFSKVLPFPETTRFAKNG